MHPSAYPLGSLLQLWEQIWTTLVEDERHVPQSSLLHHWLTANYVLNTWKRPFVLAICCCDQLQNSVTLKKKFFYNYVCWFCLGSSSVPHYVGWDGSHLRALLDWNTLDGSLTCLDVRCLSRGRDAGIARYLSFPLFSSVLFSPLLFSFLLFFPLFSFPLLYSPLCFLFFFLSPLFFLSVSSLFLFLAPLKASLFEYSVVFPHYLYSMIAKLLTSSGFSKKQTSKCSGFLKLTSNLHSHFCTLLVKASHMASTHWVWEGTAEGHGNQEG